MDLKLESSWQEVLKDEFDKSYFLHLIDFVNNEYQTKEVFPPKALIFNAFNQCSFDKVKVVIIGQDPYHGEGQANGLCFSVNDGVAFPPSLQNIFKEINRDLGKSNLSTGNLLRWAQQGVLLLNATLTVEAHSAGSHQRKGWEQLTDAIIRRLATEKEKLVFMLWGAHAQKKGLIIDPSRHLILKSVHPSPLSAYRGFIGNNHFSLANNYLIDNGLSGVDW